MMPTSCSASVVCSTQLTSVLCLRSFPSCHNEVAVSDLCLAGNDEARPPERFTDFADVQRETSASDELLLFFTCEFVGAMTRIDRMERADKVPTGLQNTSALAQRFFIARDVIGSGPSADTIERGIAEGHESSVAVDHLYAPCKTEVLGLREDSPSSSLPNVVPDHLVKAQLSAIWSRHLVGLLRSFQVP